MDKRRRAGYSAEILNCAACAVLAERGDMAMRIACGEAPKHEVKQILRRVDAAQDLDREGDTIWRDGIGITAIATWYGTLEVILKGYTYRFRLLVVDRNGLRSIYAVPARLLDRGWSLPDVEFSKAELKLLRLIADEVSDQATERRWFVDLGHPAKADVQQNRDCWSMKADPSALIVLLQKQPWLLKVIAAALDAQLRSFKWLRDAPLGIYNFTVSGGDLQADEAFCRALCAANFTNAAEAFVTAEVQEVSDLRQWRGCHDRLVVLRTASGSQLKQLFDEIDVQERARRFGDDRQSWLPTVPIVRGKNFLHRPFAVDVEIPKSTIPLTADEQDLIRSAVGVALYRDTAQRIYDLWRYWVAQPNSYRLNMFALWQEAIEQVFLDVCCESSPEQRHAARALLRDAQQAQQEAEQAREQAIQRAIELLADPSRFEREIVERPKLNEEARRLLDINQAAVAFRFAPEKGGDQGKQFLAFSRDSLKRLLKRVNCGEELYHAVLDRAARLGMLDQRSRTIKIGQGSFAAVTIIAEKC